MKPGLGKAATSEELATKRLAVRVKKDFMVNYRMDPVRKGKKEVLGGRVGIEELLAMQVNASALWRC